MTEEEELEASRRKRRRRGGAVEGGKPQVRLDRKGRQTDSGTDGGFPSKTSRVAPALGPETGKDDEWKSAEGGAEQVVGRKKGGRLTVAERHALPSKDFALPGERYPINDPNHARNALARVSQHGTPAEKSKVRAAVHRKYPGIGQD